MRVRGRPLPDLGLLLETHRSRMTVSGPRGEYEQKSGVGLGDHRVALARSQLEQVARGGRDPIAGGRRQLDLSVDNDDSGVLVNLVVLQFLPTRKQEEDHPGIVAAREDPRL